MEFFGGATYGDPVKRGCFFEQEEFHVSRFEDESGMDDPGIIEHEQILRSEPLGQIMEVVVLNGAVLAVDDHKSGMVSGMDRMAGDPVFGKVEIKVVSLHKNKKLRLDVILRQR